MATKCTKCHTENPEMSLFCSGCGTKLEAAKEFSLLQTETLRASLQELTTGSTFAGRYQIIEELGKGGMGTVYKVFDTKTREKIALKLIKPEIGSDEETIERFSNELRLSRKIGHRNVCRMFDIGETEGFHFITMEYVHGEDLKSMIRMSKRLEVGTAIAIAQQVCQGLAEAHRLGVVHRDLKSSNIMIDKDGNARIMDFGIARSLKEKGITGAGVIIGTPEYMSPEQVEGKEADQRSDIYALGVILYEMVTGHVPFQGDTPLSIAVKHKSEIPKDPRELNTQLPEGLSRVILHCLEKDKEKRFQSAAAVFEELEKIEGDVVTADRIVPIGKAKASVAVLPFEDFSPRKDQDYFCDGMTEELINRLSNIKELKVPARTSVFAFKGKADDIREIGRKLNVQIVLEGSIRKIDNQLRVTAKLINVLDGFHLWSETYNRELKDVFNIWDEIALTIADKLKLTLLSDEKARLVKHSTENLEAYNLYLLGRYFLDRASTEEDFNKIIAYFEQALAKDPGYALAFVGQARCYSLLCLSGYLAPKESYPKAIEAAKKALELDDELGEAHASLGYLKWVFDWDITGAEHEFRRALKLSPGSVDVHIPYSMYLATTGRFDEAIAGFKHAVELDPAVPANYVSLGQWGYHFAGRYDEAIVQIKRGLDMDPSLLWGQIYLAPVYALKGMHEEAVALADKVISAWPKLEDVHIFSFLGWVYAVSGRQEKARSLLKRMLELRTRRYVDAYLIVEVYAGLGEKDKAFEWLDKAYEEHAGQIIFVTVDPWIENLRSDSRYTALVRKIGWGK